MKSEEYKALLESHQVPAAFLRNECDDRIFSFELTSEIREPGNELIGQKRAEEAMELGLSVEQSGYNLFVAGPSGTGRLTFTTTSVTRKAAQQPVPDDWCYVYNFSQPLQPQAISLPAGGGIHFQNQIQRLLKQIEYEIKEIFSNQHFEKEKREIFTKYENKGKEAWKNLEKFANDLSFNIERTHLGIQSYPVMFGEPVSKEEFQKLSEDQRGEFSENSKAVKEKIRETVRLIQEMEEKARKSVDLFIKQTISSAIEGYFQPLYNEYHDYPKILSYLKQYFQNIVENFSIFLDEEKGTDNLASFKPKETKQTALSKYTVHLFINNKELDGAPVIYETNPTFQNLFGKVEFTGSLHNLISDFTKIRPGAVHHANGGYLILQASEILQQPGIWNHLKRILRTGSIRVENSFEDRLLFPAGSIKPERIPLQLKVILIGSYSLYEMLSSFDEDFHKLFKVKVEFDTEMEKSVENEIKMANFVKRFAENENLLPFHRRAIAKIIDYSSRIVGDQKKLTTRFQEITKILVESSFWAKRDGSKFIDAHHIRKAIEKSNTRSNRMEEKYLEWIQNGTIMVDVAGEKVGQINGLAVLGSGDRHFGIPSKITAQTFLGKSGIMNIERETALSGQIHHKGVLILTGFISGTFAKNKPLPLSASITFEQTYNLVDGDSASSSELYVLLSSLANIPIKQGIAVTGSVNQWGEVQPIGGVNEKIEGFYKVCGIKGLTGEQGVIIPKQNRKNLMLSDEVVEAVRAGKFHIWTVENISEGIEILTGVRAGSVRDKDGKFPIGTVFYYAEKRLEEMARIIKYQKS